MKKSIIVLLVMAVFIVTPYTPSVVFSYQHGDDVSKAEFIDNVYIPKNLDEACKLLEDQMSPETKRQYLSKDDIGMVGGDFFSDMGVRNDWGLWRGSRLAKWFNGIGIFHPDDMSMIINTSLMRKINNFPIKLEEQVLLFKEFWLNREEPNSDTFPENGLKEIGAQAYETPMGKFNGYIKIYKSVKSGNIWLYEHKYGWKKADTESMAKYKRLIENANK